MKKFLLCSLGMFLLFFTSVDARAYIVFGQSPQSTPGGLVSSPGGSPAYTTATVYDDFTLTSSYSITGINWWGFYQYPYSNTTPVFTLTLYPYNIGDSSASPPNSGVTVSYSFVSATAYGGGVYEYSAVLTTPLNLTANTYWLSIYNSVPVWGWQRAYPNNDGIYTGSIQTSQSGIQSNVAFQLIEGPPVPIPTAAWLLALGLIGLAVVRRRIRR